MYKYVQSKKEVNEQLGTKMNQNIDGSKVNGRKLDSCRRLRGRNRRLALGEDGV